MKTKQILFLRAHQIAKNTHVNFSLALKKSWAILKLTQKMRSEVVQFAYKKVDGSLRIAFGTLKDHLVTFKGTNRPPNINVQTYYDMQRGALRCFKIENLISLS